VLRCTISPDGRFGVLVPKLEELEHLEMTYRPQNQVIELATGNVIAVIRTDWVGPTRQNHGGVLQRVGRRTIRFSSGKSMENGFAPQWCF